MAARKTIRTRLRIETALAVLTAFLAVLTAISGEWIEAIFDVDPDGGDGSLEWLIVLAFAVVAIIAGLLARADKRRLATS